MDLDLMIKEAKERLAAQLDEDVSKAHAEIAAAFEQTRKDADARFDKLEAELGVNGNN